MKKPPIGTPPREASKRRLAEEQAKREPIKETTEEERARVARNCVVNGPGFIDKSDAIDRLWLLTLLRDYAREKAAKRRPFTNGNEVIAAQVKRIDDLNEQLRVEKIARQAAEAEHGLTEWMQRARDAEEQARRYGLEAETLQAALEAIISLIGQPGTHLEVEISDLIRTTRERDGMDGMA